MIESRDHLQSKLDNINDNCYVIARDKPNEKHQEDESSNQFEIIQEEIRKLHFQLSQKDNTILQLKKYIGKSKGSDENYDDD